MNKMQRDSFAREENRLLKANLTAQEKLVNETMAHYSEIKLGCDFAIVFYKFDNIFFNNRIIAKQH